MAGQVGKRLFGAGSYDAKKTAKSLVIAPKRVAAGG
jgi:hypothetical protein